MKIATMMQPALTDLKTARFNLWVDGAGGFLVLAESEITIGAATDGVDAADISLLAPFSRRQMTIIRQREGYLLDPHAEVNVNGRSVDSRVGLADEDVIQSAGVEIRFGLPTVLSSSARLEFLSPHRPEPRRDGVVLMGDHLFMGAGESNHIRCPDWSQQVLLFSRQGELQAKVGTDLMSGNQKLLPIDASGVVTGDDWQFRIEQVG